MIRLEALIIELEVRSLRSLMAGLRQPLVIDLLKRFLDTFQIAGKHHMDLPQHLSAFHVLRNVRWVSNLDCGKAKGLSGFLIMVVHYP